MRKAKAGKFKNYHRQVCARGVERHSKQKTLLSLAHRSRNQIRVRKFFIQCFSYEHSRVLRAGRCWFDVAIPAWPRAARQLTERALARNKAAISYRFQQSWVATKLCRTQLFTLYSSAALNWFKWARFIPRSGYPSSALFVYFQSRHAKCLFESAVIVDM